MKYIIILLCLCACKQQHEANKMHIEPFQIQRRLSSWTMPADSGGCSVESHYAPSTGVPIYCAHEKEWHPDSLSIQSEQWYVCWADSIEQKRLWSVALIKDTAHIMTTGADSLFKKCKVIRVAGKIFKPVELTKNKTK